MSDDKPQCDIQQGDRVIISLCPRYRTACGGHNAKVIGKPVLARNDDDSLEYVAPIRFNCIGIQHANYPCNRMLKRGKLVNMKLTRPAIITLVVFAVVGILFLWGAGNYNDLVRSRNEVNNSKAQIDTELTRRYDVLDNVVQSVQGSQAQESDVFGKIAEARKIGGSSDSTSEQSQQANQTIDTQIALLPRLQEAYPELRSNDQVTRLINELQGSNNTIRDKRNAYNQTVTNYNNNITSFPKNIFAGIFNFDQAKLFEATAQERVNPKVELDREKN